MLAEMSEPTWITVIITALVGFGGVLKWIGKRLDNYLDSWIETEKARTDRIRIGTQFITECIPRYDEKLDKIIKILSEKENDS